VRRLAFALALASAWPAIAHDKWGNGEPVPDWVRKACCGPEDVHHIPASAIHIMSDGYHIDGIETVVPANRALPSPDGDYWGFWLPAAEPNPVIFCLFAPLNGT